MIVSTNQLFSRQRLKILFKICLLLAALTSTLTSTLSGETGVSAFGRDKIPDAQGANTSDAATRIFNEGRNLIANEEWAKAADRFNEVATRYPQSEHVDASLYWLAFALKKQSRLRGADQVLERLQTEFPHSPWKDDAGTLRIEIAPRLGNTKLVLDQIEGANNDETKLVALQSLFEIDPKRALAVTSSILKTNSSAGKGLQEGAVALAGERGGEKAMPILLDVAQNGVETRIRVTAIVGMKNSENEKVLSLLEDLATNSDDETIIAASLFALSEHNGARATEILRQVSLKAKTLKARKQALHFFSQRGVAGVVDSLIQMYDMEKDEAIKAQILFSLSESKQKVALRKLTDVARGDQSLKLRQVAIHFLSQSTDPEARKFVEEMIK
ncbi:MAG: tetratricopeptide repeat protein [Pyrinomonadaceae bacterium]